jgi:hypothetical protein
MSTTTKYYKLENSSSVVTMAIPMPASQRMVYQYHLCATIGDLAAASFNIVSICVRFLFDPKQFVVDVEGTLTWKGKRRREQILEKDDPLCRIYSAKFSYISCIVKNSSSLPMECTLPPEAFEQSSSLTEGSSSESCEP